MVDWWLNRERVDRLLDWRQRIDREPIYRKLVYRELLDGQAVHRQRFDRDVGLEDAVEKPGGGRPPSSPPTPMIDIASRSGNSPACSARSSSGARPAVRLMLDGRFGVVRIATHPLFVRRLIDDHGLIGVSRGNGAGRVDVGGFASLIGIAKLSKP